ncbi:MAG: hypothetical protein WCK89_06450 [bacterium]
MNTVNALALTIGTLALLSTGCASVQRGSPIASTEVSVNLARTDYTVIGPVKGTSTMQSYVLGLVKIIDGDKLILLGMKTFEDQYAFLQDPGLPILQVLTLGLSGGPTAEDRAYYKALAATPDADVVIPKAYVKQISGIPLLASMKEVTFTGKAVKIKAD